MKNEKEELQDAYVYVAGAPAVAGVDWPLGPMATTEQVYDTPTTTSNCTVVTENSTVSVTVEEGEVHTTV